MQPQTLCWFSGWTKNLRTGLAELTKLVCQGGSRPGLASIPSCLRSASVHVTYNNSRGHGEKDQQLPAMMARCTTQPKQLCSVWHQQHPAAPNQRPYRGVQGVKNTGSIAIQRFQRSKGAISRYPGANRQETTTSRALPAL